MDNRAMEKKELNPEEMDQAAGGFRFKTKNPYKNFPCVHPHKTKTGREREDSRYLVFSQHQFEYVCPDCGKKFWADEEPSKPVIGVPTITPSQGK